MQRTKKLIAKCQHLSQSFSPRARFQIFSAIILLGIGGFSACTKAVKGQFKINPDSEMLESGFDVGETVEERSVAPVDILWVIDNSGSMKPSQAKLRSAFGAFAKEFLKSTYDIHLGIITTDAYTGDPMWKDFLSEKMDPKRLNAATAAGRLTVQEFHPRTGQEYALMNEKRFFKTKDQKVSELVSRFTKLFESKEDGSPVDEMGIGIKGVPEERGFDSVRVFLNENEVRGQGSVRLFRPNSQRIIVFLTDEDDQSIDDTRFDAKDRAFLSTGHYYIGKDEKTSDFLNPPQFTIKCSPSTVEGKELAPLNICVRPGMLTSVNSFKSQVDSFFHNLDGTSSSSEANWMTVGIVTKTLATVEDLRKKSPANDISHEVGQRYIDLVDQVRGASFSMDIGVSSYSEVLKKIGLEVVKNSTKTAFKPQTKFRLKRVPMEGELFVVTVVSADGSSTVLTPSQYTIVKNDLLITDQRVIGRLKKGDQVKVRYQPATVLPAA